MRQEINDRGQKPGGRRVALCLAAAVICVTMVCGQCWAHNVAEVYDFYVKANPSDQNDTEADVCNCGYWVFVEWWAKTTHGDFDIEIWQPGEPTGPEEDDFYPPSGTKIAETSHSTSGSNMGHVLFEVNDVNALSLGEHTIRAWVIETSTSPPNAWEYSDECTVNVVDSCCDDFDCKYYDEGVCKPCLYKASDYEELEECSDIVDDPDTSPVPNGCSVPPIICYLLPDCNNPTGGADTSFLNACNGHDTCYQTCNSSQGSCDNDFLDAMIDVCTGSICAVPCFAYAEAYYGAVHNYGEPYWQEDQVDACACCECS